MLLEDWEIFYIVFRGYSFSGVVYFEVRLGFFYRESVDSIFFV